MTSATEDECSSTDMIVIVVIMMIIMIMVIMVIVIMATVHCAMANMVWAIQGFSPRVISNANLKSLHFYKSESESSS